MATADAFLSDGYRCGICNNKFYHPALIYCCYNGHFFCRKCYKQKSLSSTDPFCPHQFCSAEIGRMDMYAPTRGNGSCHKRRRKMFPTPENVVREHIRQAESQRSLHTFIRGDSASTHSVTPLSRKPVNCPYPGCEKNIAVAAVSAHFKYEHKFVAAISTFFGTRNGLEFNPYDVKCSEKVCLVLINILPDEDEELPGVSRSSARSQTDISSIKSIMLVMATRIPYYELYKEEQLTEDEEDEGIDDYDLYGYSPHDKIFIWVASNLPTRCKYTIAVSTSRKGIRLKYTGKVSQMNENCIKLCESGRGLILNQPHTMGMSNSGKKTLSLDIIVQREELENHR